MGRPKIKEKQLGVAVHNLKFDIYDNENTNRRTGIATFDVVRSFDSMVVEEYNLKVDLISCWQLPTMPACVKAHMILRRDEYHHIMFRKDMQKLGEIKVNSRETCMDHVDYSMLVSDRVIRYGQSSSKKGFIQVTDPVRRTRMRLYESKAAAVSDIIDSIRVERSLGGFKRINFSVLNDDILNGVGFVKMPDIMGRGVPMWTGDRNIISTGDQWDTGAMDREAANAQSFLDLLQTAVGG